MIVLDASAVIDLLLNRSPAARSIAERVAAESPALAAPHLLDAEVGQVLRRFVLASQISARRAVTALDDFAFLPITRYPHTPLLKRAFALRAHATFYDALYLSLSEGLDAAFITCDKRLATIPGARARVEVVEGSSNMPQFPDALKPTV
ncbi:type II toxin-antitoxin system ribonuclease VapC1 [soil metagenome]